MTSQDRGELKIRETDPQRAADAAVSMIRQWFRLLARDRWEQAIAMIGRPKRYGIGWTVEIVRRAIEVETFGPGTRFRTAHPEGIVYSDPDTMTEPPDFWQKWAGIHHLKDGTGFAIDYPVPLNGEWSDLTAQFSFLRQPGGYEVELEDLHVL